ncbi:MAG: ribose ABC transporter permease, partial [bacterium]
TVIGAFIVGTLNNIMNLSAVNSYLQQIIRGAIIALAVIYDTYSKNMRVESQKGEIDFEKYKEDNKE